MKRRLTALFAMAVTLTLGLALGRWSPWTARTPAPVLAASPTASPAPARLAYLHTAAEPWQAETDRALEELCRGWGWAYVSYDCQGDPAVQKGQAGDLLRDGGADLAVVSAAEAEGAAEWVKILGDNGCRVVSLGPETGGAAWGVTFDETDLAAAAADFLRGSKGVILLPDLAQDPRTDAIQTVFAQRDLPILETGSTWGDVDFGRDYLTAALERWPQADGVVTFSRTGALAAAQALEGRPEVRTLCLSCSPDLREDVAQGRLDAALTPSAQGAAQALKELLPLAAEGKRPGRVSLKIETVK